MRTQTIEADIIVVGGGLAGVSAAVAAARLGRRTVLINNRPVLGGNSSSEVRVWVCGATAHGNQRWARETGIMGEMFLENQYRNPEGNPVYWDDVVLDTVRREPNLQLFLNTEVIEAGATGPDDDRRVTSVTGWTMGSEIRTVFHAPIFLDCTGDGLVGRLVGARHRLGKEGRAEFDEAWAPEEPIREFLGSTLLFYTKDLGHPVKFVAPETAKDISTTPIPATRIIRSGDSGAHYWWIEWGGQLDIVDDNERIRDELRSVILGIWDHIKNSGEFDADNLTLEWIGNLPGKREYRRFVGDHTLRQQDVLDQVEFDDGIGFGGWSIDLHPAEGMYATGAGAVQRFSDGVFEIPFRSLYSANVSNLLMAGRNISATHIAFGAARVMATCAVMGEAAGTAASLCLSYGESPRELYANHRRELRQALLRSDSSLIGVANEDPQDLARRAVVTASSRRRTIATDAGGAAPHPLADDLGIVIPVHPALETTDLLLGADEATTLTVEVWSSSKRQNVVPERLEHTAVVEVPAGAASWVSAPTPFFPETPQNAIVVLRANPAVRVQLTSPLPAGVLTLVHRADNDDENVEISDEGLLVKWPTKPLRGRVPVFRTAPETEALAPERAVSGYNRPFGGPNMWASEPLADDTEWLRLDWDAPVEAREVRLVFDDDVDVSLITLHHHRTPDEIMPQLVRDYRVEVLPAGSETWTTVVAVQGNRHRHRIHALPAGLGAFRAARLVVEATNGAAEARVIAFRVQA
ncbi:FAD-dependent oxidoreductase [Microbacterium bovistercoris]|uniref:FAD-dependent oxidoreductase n=1 Tax=Microbacterium bovistercoris TaxID=2293570 RepID=A0A371NW65_9MICO|nr:FAD-dependent oxidoreductase [Microbacterium bovistercoris]REJ07216.1 FAD-dependent oxidoreductase [Microbacterium bovistercoris]